MGLTKITDQSCDQTFWNSVDHLVCCKKKYSGTMMLTPTSLAVCSLTLVFVCACSCVGISYVWVSLYDITFSTPWYIITHDITILLNIENWAEVSAFFATPLIMMADLLDDHAACAWPLSTCKYRSGWRFFKWLQRLEVFSSLAATSSWHTQHFEWSGDHGFPFSSASNPKCFQTGAMVFRLATSSILGSVSLSPALAGSIDTGLSLTAILKPGHVH